MSSLYARADSEAFRRKGHLFNRPFGSAPKTDEKKARTLIIYIGNNPVEKELCKNAIEYRWNYLAYAKSDHPFSEPLVISKASNQMKKAVKLVRRCHSRGKPLSHQMLKILFNSLGKRERMQLVDFIITTYSVIDYGYAAAFFDGVDDMINSMRYNTGSEHDIIEEFSGKSDRCYAGITRWLLDKRHFEDIHDVFLLDEEERAELLFQAHSALGINLRQLAKYFRLKYTVSEK